MFDTVALFSLSAILMSVAVASVAATMLLVRVLWTEWNNS